MTGRDDAALAARQLWELTAEGFPVAFVADTALISLGVLYAIRAGRRTRIHTTTREAITGAYLRLHGTDPAAHGIRPGSVGVARLQAARNGRTREAGT